MEIEKTRLQKITEQLSEKIKIAIEQDIDNGARIDKDSVLASVMRIDGVCVQKSVIVGSDACIVLDFKSEKLRKIFAQNEKEYFEKRIKELTDKLNEQSNETDND